MSSLNLHFTPRDGRHYPVPLWPDWQRDFDELVAKTGATAESLMRAQPKPPEERTDFWLATAGILGRAYDAMAFRQSQEVASYHIAAHTPSGENRSGVEVDFGQVVRGLVLGSMRSRQDIHTYLSDLPRLAERMLPPERLQAYASFAGELIADALGWEYHETLHTDSPTPQG